MAKGRLVLPAAQTVWPGIWGEQRGSGRVEELGVLLAASPHVGVCTRWGFHSKKPSPASFTSFLPFVPKSKAKVRAKQAQCLG